jgi:hypothetical protein
MTVSSLQEGMIGALMLSRKHRKPTVMALDRKSTGRNPMFSSGIIVLNMSRKG